MPASDPTSAVPGLTIHLAQSFFARLGGLLVRPALSLSEGLLLRPCSSVHTAFMRYAIDVVFLDEQGHALKVVANLAPWRTAWCLAAVATLELRGGQAQRRGITPGARVLSPRSLGAEA